MTWHGKFEGRKGQAVDFKQVEGNEAVTRKTCGGKPNLPMTAVAIKRDCIPRR